MWHFVGSLYMSIVSTEIRLLGKEAWLNVSALWKYWIKCCMLGRILLGQIFYWWIFFHIFCHSLIPCSVFCAEMWSGRERGWVDSSGIFGSLIDGQHQMHILMRVMNLERILTVWERRVKLQWGKWDQTQVRWFGDFPLKEYAWRSSDETTWIELQNEKKMIELKIDTQWWGNTGANSISVEHG